MADKQDKYGWLPAVAIILGTLGALTVFVLLFALDFKLFDLVYYLPALVISALFIFGGIRWLKNR